MRKHAGKLLCQNCGRGWGRRACSLRCCDHNSDLNQMIDEGWNLIFLLLEKINYLKFGEVLKS